MPKPRHEQLDTDIALQTGRATPQTIYGSTTVDDGLTLKGNSVDDLGIVVNKDGSVTINESYTIPNADGSANQILKTNGLGVVTWQNDEVGTNYWQRITGGTNYVLPATAADDIGADAARITKGWYTEIDADKLIVDEFELNGDTMSMTSSLNILTNGTLDITTSANDFYVTSAGIVSIDASIGMLLRAQSDNITLDVQGGNDLIINHLSVANGIMQTSGAGLVSSSTVLPDGTTATTQSQADNSTKIATTAYVDTAVLTGDKVAAPATPTSTGSTGQWAYGSGYMYRCVNTDTWVRWAVVTSWT